MTTSESSTFLNPNITHKQDIGVGTYWSCTLLKDISDVQYHTLIKNRFYVMKLKDRA